MRCEGAKWNLADGRLEPCEDEALWEHDGKWYCYFDVKVAQGLIASERRTPPKVERAERDPLEVLLAEWA